MQDRDRYVIAEALTLAIEVLNPLPSELRREGKLRR
jgi:hypothetical protein